MVVGHPVVVYPYKGLAVQQESLHAVSTFPASGCFVASYVRDIVLYVRDQRYLVGPSSLGYALISYLVPNDAEELPARAVACFRYQIIGPDIHDFCFGIFHIKECIGWIPAGAGDCPGQSRARRYPQRTARQGCRRAAGCPHTDGQLVPEAPISCNI